MKLRLECKEVIHRSVEINTDDYKAETIFEIAELINNMKIDTKTFINDNREYLEDSCLSNSDIENINIVEIKE